MTPIFIRSLALIGLISSLTACAQHNPAQANCFNFRDAPARTDASVTVSTSGNIASRRATECDFVMLGTGS